MKIQKFSKKDVTDLTSETSKIEAKNAVETLLNFISRDVPSEVLKNTPSRVVKSLEELYRGYNVDIGQILNKKFFDIAGYSGQVLLEDISFNSTCEHHMLPFWGSVDFAYMPSEHVVGLSKIARLVDAYSTRLQLQERLTAQIAESFSQHLMPRGVAIRIRGEHSCMRSRGISRKGCTLQTLHFIGCYKNDTNMQQQFLRCLQK